MEPQGVANGGAKAGNTTHATFNRFPSTTHSEGWWEKVPACPVSTTEVYSLNKRNQKVTSDCISNPNYGGTWYWDGHAVYWCLSILKMHFIVLANIWTLSFTYC